MNNTRQQQVNASRLPKFPRETKSFCRSKNDVQLELFPQPQPFLQHGTESDNKHFLTNIRKYNSAFQMTGFGCNEVTILAL